MEEILRQFVSDHPIAIVLLVFGLILVGVYLMREK